MGLHRFRITGKLTILVIAMAAAEVLVATQGIVSIERVQSDMEEAGRYQINALNATRMSLDLTEAGRAEMVLAAVGSSQVIEVQERVIVAQASEVVTRVAALQERVAAARQPLVHEAAARSNEYLERAMQTVAAARRAAAGEIPQARVAEVAIGNRPTYLAAMEALERLKTAVIEASARSETALRTDADRSVRITMGVALLGIVLSILAGWWIGTRAIARPLALSLRRLRGLADGDLETEVPGKGRGDEIGDLAETMQHFREKLIETRELQAREAAAVTARTQRAERLAGLTQRFEGDARAVVGTVASASTELEQTAASMAHSAETTLDRSGTVSSAGQQAAANVQTVAAATEELAASVSEISRQVSESARVSSEAVADAARTDAIVKGLSEAASRIGDVVRLINDIASQTNLLALNATIEAARAGEAGKGFAVVAAEVKNLATQTAKATDEIGGQIAAMQGATGQAVDAIGAIGKTIGRISEISSAIAAAVEEQGAATREIARNVQDAAAGTSAVSTHIGGIAEASQSTGAAAGQVLSASRELSRQAEAMRGLVDHFLTDVKAA